MALTFPLNGGKDQILALERSDGSWHVAEQAQALTPQVMMKSGEIRTSLFAATDAIGLPDAIATQMADIFGGDIDFHRDLRKGDRFSIVYEVLFSHGLQARSGRILAAEFINNGKAFRAVWFESREGQGYYTADGKNIRKAFLRSPLEFSRVTSGFTNARFHPIHHTWRAHKGVDYSAPIGTRVKATGGGIVEFAGKQGGYGNLVVIRHQGRFTTHYGHLNGFAPGVRKGARVSQGDIVGYVGRTGWATGPHLHYEFRINDVHQNPLSVALPSAPPLAAQQMAEFRLHADPLTYRLDRIRGMDLALID
jgi:murein DD-endopeptidase MepM/ murein hydrolase activator NlpD